MGDLGKRKILDMNNNCPSCVMGKRSWPSWLARRVVIPDVTSSIPVNTLFKLFISKELFS